MESNKIKILVTTGIYPPEVGGPATYTALLEREMPKHGIAVGVLPFRVVKHLPRWIRHLVFFFKVLNLGRGVDLLYTQDPVSVGFPTMLASKILRKPFLIRVAGDYAWEQAAGQFGLKDSIDDFQNKKYGFQVELMRLIQKTTTNMADKVVTPSKYFRNLVAGWNSKKDNVVTIYNGIDFGDVDEGDGSFESKTIISSGRLVPWKGFDTLIEIMKDLPGWKLVITGDGPDRARLEKLIIDNEVGDRVSLLGDVKRVDMIRKIQASQLFILNTSFESFSFVIVEAMFAGTPVISTNIGNISEIIDNGKEGLLVSPNNKAEILESVQTLSDHAVRESLVKNAKEKSKMFSLEKTINKTSELITSLVDCKKI